MNMQLKQVQSQRKIDYWWNGQPQAVTLRLLPDDQIDILRWKVITHRGGGKKIPGIVRGAGLHKQYNHLIYIVETEDGIIHSATLTPIEPGEPEPVFDET
jgi:hypothetical protein